jgi:tetratricopeptide (TPR) repeat protein
MRRALALAALLTAVAANAAFAQDSRGVCLNGRGEPKARACIEALKATPKDLALRRALARALLDLGDGIGGTGEYGAIAQDRPDDPQAWFDYGTALATDYRFNEAAVAIERALTLDPNHRDANKIAVLTYERAGRHAEAYASSLRLAGMGDAIGMYDVAESLLEGRGVKSDPPASVPWFRRAAEAGHFGAMAKLAKIYAEGLYGEKRDPTQAAEWAKKAE